MEIGKWDIVCACSVPKVNVALAAQLKKTPASLSYSGDDGTKIDAPFKSWSIVSGTDKTVVLQLVFASGTIKPMGLGNGIDLSGVTSNVQVGLEFVAEAKGTAQNLQFSFKSKADGSNAPKGGDVIVLEPDASGSLDKLDPTKMASQALKDHLALALIANAPKIALVLASLNQTPSGAHAWANAKRRDYTFGTDAAGTTQYLAVYTALSDGPALSSPQFDSDLVDGTSDIGAAFSTAIFMQHVVLPGIQTAYKVGQKGGTGQVFASGDTITGVGLTCAPVKYGALWYNPTLMSLQVSVEGAYLHSAATGSFGLTGLINASVTFSQKRTSSVRFDKASNSLQIEPHGTQPDPQYDKNIPWYNYLVYGPLAALAAPIAIAVCIGVIDAVIAIVSTAIANSVSTNGGNIDLSDGSALGISWPGFGGWDIQDASLADAFLIKANFKT